MDLAEALCATDGICCFVGAGGKKTTMYTLARHADRAVVTATVRIPPFDAHVADVCVTTDPAAAIAQTSDWPLGVVPAREGPDRYRGYEPETLAGLVDTVADVILVKADGARMRKFKAPAEHEPQIPHTARIVVPIVSAHVIGRPLEETLVHRVDRVSSITGMQPGDELTPQAVAEVLASPSGGQQGVPEGATVVPLINMVDSEALRRRAESVASLIHEKADVPRVVLARMIDPDPLVAVR